MSTNFALFGATGLVGGNILKYLLQNPTPSSILTITRRDLPDSITSAVPTSQTLTHLVDKDTSQWPILLTSSSPSKPTVLISALGTTRAAAGSFEKQYAFEHGVILSLASAAKSSGINTFVLISSGGANKTSMFSYSKMKGEIEDDIDKLGFERYIILQPGLILGDRAESRFMEGLIQGVAKGLGKISGGALADGWSTSAEIIARAAVRAALDEEIKGRRVLSHKEVVEYGKKKEW